MLYEIDTSKPIKLNWCAKSNERILQNVMNLISTLKYEVAYSRNKGIDSSILDKPQNSLIGLYTSEVFRIIGEYEPRASVKSVSFLGADDSGNMDFKVVVDI